MADRYLLESGSPDGYQLEDASGVLLLEDGTPFQGVTHTDLPPAGARWQRGFSDIAVSLLLTTLAVAVVVVAREPVNSRVPAPRAAQQVGFAQNLLQSTLASAQAPFAQEDWPVPVKARAVQQPFDTQPALTIRGGGDKPNASGDWPLPVRSRYVQQPEPPATSLAILGGGRQPFASGDWPNPIPPRGVPQYIVGNATILLPIPTDFRTLVVTPVRGLAVTQQETPQNLLPLSGVVVASPFASGDWPNPAGVGRQQPFDIQPALTIQGGGVQPFASGDWRNPLSLPRQQPDYTQNALPFAVVAAPLPFASGDWQNPRGLGRQQPFDLQPALTIVGGGIQPFASGDWQNPRGLPTQQPDLFENVLPLQLFVAPTVVPRQAVASNYSARSVQQPDYVQNYLPITFVAGPQPFASGEWPNPRGVSRQQPEQQPNAILEMGTQTVTIFSGPLITRILPRSVLQVDYPPNTLAGLFPVPPVIPSGEQLTPENPRGRPTQQPDYIQTSLAIRGGGDQPLPSWDWPNPRLPVPQTRVDNPPNTLALLIPPPNQIPNGVQWTVANPTTRTGFAPDVFPNVTINLPPGVVVPDERQEYHGHRDQPTEDLQDIVRKQWELLKARKERVEAERVRAEPPVESPQPAEEAAETKPQAAAELAGPVSMTEEEIVELVRLIMLIEDNE